MQQKDNTAAAEILGAQSENGFRASAPYPAQEPIDEMDVALSRLRILYAALTADSQRLTDCGSLDAAMVINEVLDTLDPLRTFLAENEFSNVDLSFLECRREWFARKGGTEDAVSGVSRVLSKMLDAHAEITASINRTEGDADDPDTVALCERQCRNAMAIIGYRPLTKEDGCRKAEFLREWTDGAILSEEEQNALIASMLPEGGAA